MHSYALIAARSMDTERIENEVSGIIASYSKRLEVIFESFDDTSALVIDPDLDLQVYEPIGEWCYVEGPFMFHMHAEPIARRLSNNLDDRVVVASAVDVADHVQPPSWAVAVFDSGRLLERHTAPEPGIGFGEAWERLGLQLLPLNVRPVRVIRFERPGPWMFLPVVL